MREESVKVRCAWLFVVLFTFSAVQLAGRDKKKEKAEKEQQAELLRSELLQFKTVFISGTGESSDVARQKVEDKTWMHLVQSEKEADAVLKMTESTVTRPDPYPRTFFSMGAWVETTVSMQLWKRDKLLWSKTAKDHQGLTGSGAKQAAEVLLFELNEAAGGRKVQSFKRKESAR